MKKFIFKILLFVLVIGIPYITIPLVFDPYNVFHVDHVISNGVEPNKNYIKMSYVLKNAEKFDSFLFGSSRVGAIRVDKMTDCKCYNMTYSEGVPLEHYHNIETLIQNGIIPKKIYIGRDCLSYTLFEEWHYEEPVRMPYEYLKKK